MVFEGLWFKISSSGQPAPARCDASPEPATADRSAPAAPVPGIQAIVFPRLSPINRNGEQADLQGAEEMRTNRHPAFMLEKLRGPSNPETQISQ